MGRGYGSAHTALFIPTDRPKKSGACFREQILSYPIVGGDPKSNRSQIESDRIGLYPAGAPMQQVRTKKERACST